MEEKAEPKDKNFFSKFISYFRYNAELDAKINHGLLFDAYYSLVELGSAAFFKFYLDPVKFSTEQLICIVGAVVYSGSGFIPRVSVEKKIFFEVMLLLKVLLNIMLITVAVLVLIQSNFFSQICALIDDYHSGSGRPAANPTVESICASVSSRYSMWTIAHIVLFCLRVIGFALSYRAYQVLKFRYEDQALRQKRKQRYVVLKNQIKNQEEVMVVHRRI